MNFASIWFFASAVLLCNSCKETGPYKDTEEYSFVPLTQALIGELGGVDELYKYQFYLSNSFELLRLENENLPTDKGYIDDLDSNFKVIFNIHTPGILKSTSKSMKGNDCLEILFDKNDNAYLTFASIKETFDSNLGYFYHSDVNSRVRFDHYLDPEKDGNKYYAHVDKDKKYNYKGVSWHKKWYIPEKKGSV